MYAVIETGGKQYRVTEGVYIDVELVKDNEGETVEPGQSVEIDRVLMVANDGDVSIGTPTVSGAKVKATVLSHSRESKIIVYKHKKNYHKKQGHRQHFTRLQIDEITHG